MDSLTRTLSAVADPTRRSILRRLARGPATVGELALPFDVSQQAISKHLAQLERAQLVTKRREGRRHVCSLNAAPFRELAEWAESYRQFWEDRFQGLDDYLNELQRKESRHGRKR